jgi:hypothetical protein
MPRPVSIDEVVAIDDAAAACARSAPCLADAERHIAAGSLAAARRTLGFEQATKRPSHARWLNAAGLLLLLESDVLAAASLFDDALLQQPWSVAQLAAAKNLYWAAHLLPEAAEDNGVIERSASVVLDQFGRTRDYAEATLGDYAGGPQSARDAHGGTSLHGLTSMHELGGMSVHALPVQRAVCSHPMYDSERRSRLATWRQLDGATRWRMRYFDLLRRSLTR